MQTELERPVDGFGATVGCASLLLFGIVFAIYHLWSQRSDVPIVLKDKIQSTLKRQQHFYENARSTLAAGHESFPGQIYQVDTPGGRRFILPVSFLDELKSHRSINFNKATDNIFIKDLTGLGGTESHTLNILKTKLNLTKYGPVLQDIIRREIPLLFTKQNDWESTKVKEKISSLISTTAARVFHGEQASRNEEWLRLAPQYVDATMEYLSVLRAWPNFLRPIVARFTKQRGEINDMRKRGSAIIAKSLESGVDNDPPSLLDLSRGQSLPKLVETQMAMVVAGVLTTTAICVHLLFDIAAHPEAIPELREEAKEVYESCGGVFDKKALGKLEKLDSWMKESSRLNNVDMTTFLREAVQDVKLSNGVTIPKGTCIEIPLHAIQTDEATFPNSLEFDGFRFYKMRQTPGSEAKHTYVSSGKQDLAWGYGRHACPGRWLAEMQIKVIIVEILMQYDVKYAEGQSRPKNIEMETAILPDSTAEIMMRCIDGAKIEV